LRREGSAIPHLSQRFVAVGDAALDVADAAATR
jgi:hypothetical protein